jgi:hypothetical protein
MSYTPPEATVAVRCLALNGTQVWAVPGLVSTGLNNNPNLDVGTLGDVLLYSKPDEDTRNLTLLAADTGAQVGAARLQVVLFFLLFYTNLGLV